MCNGIRAELGRFPHLMGTGIDVPATVSARLAPIAGDVSVEEAIYHADLAFYTAKKKGR